MRGIGGPLLCIGDLLSDVGEADSGDHLLDLDRHDQTLKSPPSSSPSSSDISHRDLHFQPSDLTNLFQENYEQLNKALAGTDHSWTSLTLKLCTALDTAKKLIESTNSNVMELSEKVEELEKVMKKGDSAISEVRSIHSSLSQRIASSNDTKT